MQNLNNNTIVVVIITVVRYFINKGEHTTVQNQSNLQM